MKTQSAKAKGRRLQQWVRDMIYKTFPVLKEGDVRSTSMGAGGEDIQLSPKARKSFPYSVECKSKAKYAVYKDYDQAVSNCGKYQPLLVIKADRRDPLVVIDAKYFFKMVKRK